MYGAKCIMYYAKCMVHYVFLVYYVFCIMYYALLCVVLYIYMCVYIKTYKYVFFWRWQLWQQWFHLLLLCLMPCFSAGGARPPGSLGCANRLWTVSVFFLKVYQCKVEICWDAVAPKGFSKIWWVVINLGWTWFAKLWVDEMTVLLHEAQPPQRRWCLNSGRNLGETLTFLCWTFLSDCVWSHCAFCLTPTKRQVCIQCVRLCVVSIVVFFFFVFFLRATLSGMDCLMPLFM